MNHHHFNRQGLLYVFIPGSLAVLAAWRVDLNLFSLFGVRGFGLLGLLIFVIFSLTAGLVLAGIFSRVGRLVQRLFFGPIPGSFFLERASRDAGLLRVKLAHNAGHSFDRNFPQSFRNAFRNYFKYETTNEELRDKLCLSALAERSPDVHGRLEKLAAVGRLRLNLAGLFLLYTAARLVWIVGSGLPFNILRVLELALAFLLFLGFIWGYLCQVSVYYHELYLAFFALTVAEKVDRPHVKLQQSGGGRSQQRRRRRRPDSGGGGQSPRGDSRRPNSGGGGQSPRGDSRRPNSGGGGQSPRGDSRRPNSGGGGQSPRGDSN